MSLSKAYPAAVRSAAKKGLPVSSWTLLNALGEENADIGAFLKANPCSAPDLAEPTENGTFQGLYTTPVFLALKQSEYEKEEGEITECRHLFRALARESTGAAGAKLRQLPWGREAEGAPVLRELLSKTQEPRMASVRACFLARVEPEWLPIAKMLDPTTPYLRFANTR